MFRPALVICAALLAPALAQEAPISIYFAPCRDQRLNDAIIAALTQPPFILATKPTPGALDISIPDRIDTGHSPVSGTTWDFDVVFSRDGSPRGRSAQSCNENKMSDCTDQLVSDIKSAAGMP